MPISRVHGAQRYGVIAAVVAAWMALGWWLGLDANAYLAVGVPITVAFQLIVARKSIASLWVFERVAGASKRRWWWLAALVVVPLHAFMTQEGLPATVRLWLLLSAAGLVAGAWSCTRRRGTRSAWGMALAATVAGSGAFLFAAWSGGRTVDGIDAAGALRQLVMYFGVGFMVEEVTFRGAFDPYLVNGLATSRMQWITAIGVSLLWGFWHFPMVFATPADCLSFAAVQILLFQVGLGCVLSFTARAAGSLVPSALAHAVIDTVRNVVMR